MIERYHIQVGVFNLIKNHANTAAPGGFEVGGRILLEQDRLVSYEPQVNRCTEAGFFEPPEPPRFPWAVLHTHPERSSAAPSTGDVAWARANGAVRFAIFAPDSHPPELIVWHLHESEEPGAARPVPVVREQPRKSPRLPPRRPGRR